MNFDDFNLDKLDASLRTFFHACEHCVVYVAGVVTGLLVTWVF